MTHVQALIFAVLVVAWLAYLVPIFVVRHRASQIDEEPREDFPETMSIVSRGACTITSDEENDEEGVEISTPLTRSYARRDMRRSWALAARRRRRTMLGIIGLTVVAAVLAGFGLVTWWLTAVGGLLLVAFLVIARRSVVVMGRSFDRRMVLIDEGWDEPTVSLEVSTEPFRPDDEPTSRSIDLSGPVTRPQGSLWDDVVVTSPTYVSTPLRARTVRTIDLTAPGPVPGHTDVPVTEESLQVTVATAAESDLDAGLRSA